MAHYAFLNQDNIVTEVIVGKNEGEDGINWEEWYGNFRGQVCKRTSYNTQGGNHLLGGIPYRKITQVLVIYMMKIKMHLYHQNHLKVGF